MKIYMTDTLPLEDEKIFSQMLPFITEDRKNKIVRLKKREDRCRSLAAGLLLEYALQEYGISLLPGKMRQAQLAFGENGKPILNDNIGIHFNLSHSGRYVAGVFSESEAGMIWNKSERDRAGLQNVFLPRRNIWHYRKKKWKIQTAVLRSYGQEKKVISKQLEKGWHWIWHLFVCCGSR